MSELPAGRELDALVAEKVMGWTLGEPEYVMGYLSHGGSMMRLWQGPGIPNAEGETPSEEGFKPSTDIADAWEVVEKLAKDGLFVEIHENSLQHWCAIWKNNGNSDYGWLAKEYALSAPLAICRAALAAVASQETPT